MGRTSLFVHRRAAPSQTKKTKIPLVYSASYRARPKERELDKKETDLLFFIYVTKPVRTDGASLTFFITNKDGTLHLYIYHQKKNAI